MAERHRHLASPRFSPVTAYGVDRGLPLEVSRTLAVNTLVVMEIFHLFFIRNLHGTSLTWKVMRGTKVVWMTVSAIVVAQFAFTYAPVLQSVFSTASMSLGDGLLLVGIGAILFAILEIEKQLRLILTPKRAESEQALVSDAPLRGSS